MSALLDQALNTLDAGDRKANARSARSWSETVARRRALLADKLMQVLGVSLYDSAPLHTESHDISDWYVVHEGFSFRLILAHIMVFLWQPDTQERDRYALAASVTCPRCGHTEEAVVLEMKHLGAFADRTFRCGHGKVADAVRAACAD